MRRPPPLVCQHLENISRDALAKYQNIIREYVRNRHGIYALYRKSRLYYVGLATDLRRRVGHHLRDRHGESWDRFSVYLTIGDSHLRELEALLLRIVKTKGNRQRGKFDKSEDLRRRFSRDVRNSWQAEMHDLLGLPLRAKRKQPAPAPEQNGRTPILAPYVRARFKLRARHKGHTLHARVRRNGAVYYAGEIYNSPSLAAAAACKRPTCNGWTFWQYERAPGDWVALDVLRQ